MFSFTSSKKFVGNGGDLLLICAFLCRIKRKSFNKAKNWFSRIVLRFVRAAHFVYARKTEAFSRSPDNGKPKRQKRWDNDSKPMPKISFCSARRPKTMNGKWTREIWVNAKTAHNDSPHPHRPECEANEFECEKMEVAFCWALANRCAPAMQPKTIMQMRYSVQWVYMFFISRWVHRGNGIRVKKKKQSALLNRAFSFFSSFARHSVQSTESASLGTINRKPRPIRCSETVNKFPALFFVSLSRAGVVTAIECFAPRHPVRNKRCEHGN